VLGIAGKHSVDAPASVDLLDQVTHCVQAKAKGREDSDAVDVADRSVLACPGTDYQISRIASAKGNGVWTKPLLATHGIDHVIKLHVVESQNQRVGRDARSRSTCRL
jgi:hypothetical protein